MINGTRTLGAGSIRTNATTLSLILAGVATSGFALPAVGPQAGTGSEYPNRPVRVIVPFGVGSITDVLTRVLMPRLADNLGQSFIVDNRPGAGGNIGTDLGVKAAPDGYTLIMSSASTLAVNGFLFRNMPYDMATAFAPITQIAIARSPTCFVVSPMLPVKSVQELVAYGKAYPGKLVVRLRGRRWHHSSRR